jgi:hypothetical protein
MLCASARSLSIKRQEGSSAHPRNLGLAWAGARSSGWTAEPGPIALLRFNSRVLGICLSPTLRAISSSWADTLSRWQLIIVPIRRGGASVAAFTRQITVRSNIPSTFHVHHLTLRSWKECGCSSEPTSVRKPEKAISDRHHSFCFARLHTNEQSPCTIARFSSGVPS